MTHDNIPCVIVQENVTDNHIGSVATVWAITLILFTVMVIIIPGVIVVTIIVMIVAAQAVVVAAVEVVQEDAAGRRAIMPPAGPARTYAPAATRAAESSNYKR